MQKVWKEIYLGAREIKLYPQEVFGDSFVFHATSRAARQIVGHAQEYWGGMYAPHVSISASTSVPQLHEIHKLVVKEVVKRSGHLEAMVVLLEGHTPEKPETEEERLWKEYGLEAETEAVVSPLKSRTLWTIKVAGFSGVELHPKEPFGDAFVHHATERIAREIFGHGMTSQWGGYSGTHVSVPWDAELEKFRQLRERVAAEVEAQAQRLVAVKAELETPCYEGRSLYRAEVDGFGGIELHCSEPLRGKGLEKFHGAVPAEDYFIYNGTERIAKTIFNFGVRSEWATPRGHYVEIPRSCSVEQARQLREKMAEMLTVHAEKLREKTRQKEMEEAKAAEQAAIEELEEAIAAYKAARARIRGLGL